jgi:hypothetical protein
MLLGQLREAVGLAERAERPDAAPTVQAAWRLIFAPEASGPFFVLIVTGALAIWNVGIAFVVGLAAYWFKK